MAVKLVIFGNGLGMALDPDHFSLGNALTGIWEKAGFLTVEQKQLIERCLGRCGAPEQGQMGSDQANLYNPLLIIEKKFHKLKKQLLAAPF